MRSLGVVKRRKFTVSDLVWGGVVAVAVLLIALLTLPNLLLRRPSHDEHGRDKANLAMLCSVIDQFRLDCGRYPTDSEGLSALREAPKGLEGWHGPYLQKMPPLDTWGRPYFYEAKGRTGYVIELLGADGRPGGEGDDADIVDGSA